MNERIRALAGQALDKVVPYTWTKLDYDEIQKLQQYFAELIVAECVQEVEGMAILMDAGHDQWNRAIGHTALHLKEHFGVE
jgi:hypothetical protein